MTNYKNIEPYTLLPEVVNQIQSQGKKWPMLMALYIIYYAKYRKNHKKKIYCSISYLEKSTGWHEQTIYKYRKQLSQLGVIFLTKEKTKGLPGQFPKTFVEINFNVVPQIPTTSKSCGPPRPSSTLNTKVIKDNKLSSIDISIKLPFTLNGITRNLSIIEYPKSHHLHPNNKLYLELAKQHYRILHKKDYLHESTTIESLTKEFRLLTESRVIKENDISNKKEAFQKVEYHFQEYHRAINHDTDISDYWPTIHGASSIRKVNAKKDIDKWATLKRAVERINKPKNRKENPRALKDHAREWDYTKDEIKIKLN